MSTPRLPWDDSVPEPALTPAARAPHPQGLRSVTVCQHGAASVRLEAVRAHVLGHRGRDVRMVAPTHDQAHDVVRAVLGDQAASIGVERAGWGGLSLRLATPALIARGLAPISPLGFEAIVTRVIARLRADQALEYFGHASRHPGFAPSLARTLTDVRLAGLAPAALDDGTPKGRDRARLASAVADALASMQHADRADVLTLAAAAVSAGGAAWSMPLALVDPPLASRLDAGLARALLEQSAEALLVLPDGDPWGSRLIDELAPHVRLASPPPQHDNALRRIQRGLFASIDVGALPDGDRSTDCLSAPGEGRECVELARVLLTHAEQGLPFDRMAVVTRAPELYASHLETALRRAGIPAYFGRGTRRPDPAGRAFLALLTCGVEDLSARRFAEYLSLGQVPPRAQSAAPGEITAPGAATAHVPQMAHESVLPDDAEALGLSAGTVFATTADHHDDAAADADAVAGGGADAETVASPSHGAAPWRWEAVLNDAQVIGGAVRWRKHLRGYLAQLAVRAEGARKDDPGSARSEAIARRIAWTTQLVDFVETFLIRPEREHGGEPTAPDRWMDGWPARDDWGGWLVRLRDLAPRILAEPTRVLATLAELQPLGGISDVSLAEVVEVLRHRLTHLPVTSPAHRYGRVFVGTPDQVRGRSFAVVCVPGLSERVFPQRSRQDPLLLDRERAAVSPDLAVDDDRVMAERLQLRLAAGAASDSLVISYASLETTQARPRVPSFYAIDLQRAVTGRVPGYEALIRDAQQRSGARLAWPAPRQPVSAIDAAEHDLSMLQQYLQGDDPDIAGRARYLFGLNPSLRRSLVARHQRLAAAWSAHDGLLAGAGALSAHRLRARTYSASALQRFASCPYQFYLSTILRLEPREEAAPLTTLDPLTRGSMVHEMLATIMRAYIARGWVPLPAGLLADAQAIADHTVSDVATSYAERLLPPIQRVWDDAVAAIRRDVLEWVRRLASEAEGWAPIHVEYGIGFPGGFGLDEASQPSPVVLPDGTQLHGVVDLIERRGPDQFRITDYKTGKYRLTDRVVVNGGRTLQPILYAMAVEAAFGGRVTASRLYYCTEDGDFTEHEWAITGETGEHGRREGLNVLAVVDRAIEMGHLPAAPSDQACTWCDFQAVCGPGAQHVPARKDSRALADLTELRRWR